MKKLSIIIPAYNEERSISQILGKIHQTRLIGETEKEILIIDDGSKDSTAEKCRQFMQAHPDLDIHYHLQPFNQGKGAALRTGIALATGDWIIIQDADLEYDPEDYNPLLQWVIENNAKVVYGSRFLKPSNKHSYLRFYLGGRLVTFVTNLLYGQHLTDEPTCYKFFDAQFLKSIPLKCQGFEFCPEVTAKVCANIKQRLIVISYYRICKPAAALNGFQNSFFGVGSQINAFGSYLNPAFKHHLVKRYIGIEYILRRGRSRRFGNNIGMCRRVYVSVTYGNFLIFPRKCRKYFLHVRRHTRF